MVTEVKVKERTEDSTQDKFIWDSQAMMPDVIATRAKVSDLSST